MPISDAQLDTYLRFDGDADGFARMATPAEKAAMPAAAWHALDELRLGLANLKAGTLSPRAAREVEARAADVLPDSAAARRFREAA
jgi:hypothetical protein